MQFSILSALFIDGNQYKQIEQLKLLECGNFQLLNDFIPFRNKIIFTPVLIDVYLFGFVRNKIV